MFTDLHLEKAFFNFENRNYWFIRTMSGLYYDEFVKNEFVAIDSDNIQYMEILDAQKKATKSRDAQRAIGNLIKERNPKATFHNVHARAIFDFCFNVKEGDIIFIPDGLEELRFGVIKDKAITIENNPKGKCPFTFRRKVEWIEKKKRRQLDAEVWPLFRTLKTVNNVNKYAEFLNPALNSLYLADNLTHLVLDVSTISPINGRTLFSLGNDILDISEDFNKYFKLDPIKEIDVKIELKSPGSIELITVGMLALGALGIIIVGLAGGKWKFKANSKKFEFEGNFETGGIIDKVNDYMNDGVERQEKLVNIAKKCQELGVVDKKGNISKLMNKS